MAIAEEDPIIRQKLLMQHQGTVVANQVIECKSCSLCRTSRRRVPFQGERGSLMVLLDAPGAYEDMRPGTIYGGDTGKLLHEALKSVGLNPSLVYVVGCRPPARPPSEAEISSCSANLHAQVNYLDPWMILCMGSVPLKALREELKITRDRGYFFDIPSMPGRWGFSTYSPSYVLRNRELTKTWNEDIRTIGAAIAIHDEFGAEIVTSTMAKMRGEYPVKRTEVEKVSGYAYAYLDQGELQC